MMRTALKPKVFLSSAFKDPSDEKFALRDGVREIFLNEGVDCWSANVASPLWTEVIESCLKELSDSTFLVVLLRSRSGGLINFDDLPDEIGLKLGPTASSILEVELFIASFLRIPCVFFAIRDDDFELEPGLRNLIQILNLKGKPNYFELSEREILEKARELAIYLRGGTLSPAWMIPHVADKLAFVRGYSNSREEIKSEQLSFISKYAPSFGDYSPGRVERFLSFASGAAVPAAGKDGPEKNVSSQTTTGRLAYLWLSLRELSKSGEPNNETARYWLDISRRWSSSAAWLGLHGYCELGVLGSFHTRNELIGKGFSQGEKFPYGPFASEIYSIGGRLSHPEMQKVRYRTALELATTHARENPDNPSGAIAIKASAKLRLAMLGSFQLVPSALLDYRRVVNFREKNHASDSQIGEAVVESAFAEFYLASKMRVGRNYCLARMREGVRLLEMKYDADRAGFVVRAKLKFASALDSARHPDEADIQRNEAIAIAERYEIFDQLMQLKRAGRN